MTARQTLVALGYDISIGVLVDTDFGPENYLTMEHPTLPNATWSECADDEQICAWHLHNLEMHGYETEIKMVQVTPTLYSVYAPWKGMMTTVAEKVTLKVAKSIIKVVGGEYRIA